MAKNISTIHINATPEHVWAVLTEPEFVKKWQYGSVLKTDWRVGSAIRFTTAWEDKVFEQWGKVLEIKPYNLIKYSLFAPRPGVEDKPENYFIMHYVIGIENGLVKLEIIQEDNRPGAVQEAPQGAENPVLNALKSLIESEAK